VRVGIAVKVWLGEGNVSVGSANVAEGGTGVSVEAGVEAQPIKTDASMMIVLAM